MDFTTEIENGKVHLYCWENEHKVSDYVLEFEEVQNLARVLLSFMFDNILEQNKDVLIRLKNNEPAPKTVNADDVIEWLENRHLITSNGVRYCLSKDDIKEFKKDFGL